MSVKVGTVLKTSHNETLIKSQNHSSYAKCGALKGYLVSKSPIIYKAPIILKCTMKDKRKVSK